jgi:hypothetical protein
VRKNLLIVVMIVTALLLPAAAAARQEPLVIWHALAPEDSRVIEEMGSAFESASGAAVVVEYRQPQRLFEAVRAAGRAGPDVIIASNDTIAPLVDQGLIRQADIGGGFFLERLFDNLPDLISASCGRADPGACLWPSASPRLPVTFPDGKGMDRAMGWVCESSPWVAFCSGEALSGAPVSWWFNLYLINTAWLGDQGLEMPVTVDELDGLRNKHGLDFVWADQDSIPLVDEAGYPLVFVVPSALLARDPDRVMSSLGSFYEAGYAPVLELGVDAIYVSASAANPDLAVAFAEFVRSEPALVVGLWESSQRLPAFTADAVFGHGVDTPAGQTILQAMMLLTTYGAQMY